MPVVFDEITVGQCYSRHDLVRIWGYGGVEAISRGVVTPKDDNKIILFVTQEKHPDAKQYDDELADSVLLWEGPNDHFAEERMIDRRTSDEVHLFYRNTATDEFTYMGQLSLWCCERVTNAPSRFAFRLLRTLVEQTP